MNILAYPAALRGIMSIFLAIISFFYTLAGKPSIPHGKELDMTDYQLVWSDEFDGEKLDTAKWRQHGFTGSATEVRKGGYWNLGLVSVVDGNLHIATKYLENGVDGKGPAGWYSGAIDTNNSYKPVYGYYECRCILPEGNGLWSAFWLFADTVSNIDGSGVDGNEVDIFESAFYNNEKARNSVQGAIHYDGYGDAHKMEQSYWATVTANNPYENYNTYGLEWNKDSYIFYINGIQVAKTSFGGVCQAPSRLILSVEIGGENGTPAISWVGDPITTNTIAPTDFVVDYVRVYQK